MVLAREDFPFDPSREDNWVFSYGDTSGFGFHGDFGKRSIQECRCNVSFR